MFKVLFLINSMTDGGAEKHVKDLIEQLFNDNYNVELICIEKDKIYEINNDIKITYLTSWNKNTSKIKKLFFLPLLSYKLYKYVKLNKISVIQSHLFRANFVNLLSKVFFNSNHKSQVVNHSVISRLKNEGMSGKINLFLIKILYPYANNIISVSNIVQRDMDKQFDFKCRQNVIHNIFNIEKIKMLAEEDIDDFIFDKSKRYIISVGRLIKLKRNKDLLESLTKLEKNIDLIILGEGSEKNNLIEYVNEYNLSSRVYFLGWKSNPYKYIKNSDLLICTSETESFGNILIEAMACCTPVISTKCGGPEEIIINGHNGTLIDIGDIDTMSREIELVLNDNIIRTKYINNGITCSKKFDAKAIIKDYKKIINQ